MAKDCYRVEFTAAARRQLRKLPNATAQKIVRAAEALEPDPRPPEVKKLAGKDDLYRIRVGDHRVIYRIEDDRLVVLIVRVGHRRDVYRGGE